MSVKVTENWSGRTLSLRWPWTATREFMVTGVADEVAALTAVDATTGLAIPQRDAGHPANADRLTCDGPAVKEIKGGGVAYVIACSYSVTDLGDKGAGSNPDPLQEPVKIRWTSANETKESDFDLDNRPILDSAGNSAGTMDLPVKMKRLTITKPMPYYDITLSETYENATNSEPIDFSGVITAQAEHVHCDSIQPATDYTPNASFVVMEFTFTVVFDSVLGTYPFQDRRLDAGRTGWYGSGTNQAAAKFSSRAKPDEPLDEDVRLDGTGKPLTKPYNSLITVGGTNSATIPPAVTSVYKREFYDAGGNVQSSANANTVAVFNIFKRARVVDFTPLLALL